MSIDQVVEALKVSLAERDALRLQNAELLDARTDPVAIVGMACRYPGGVSSAQELWDLIVSGRDSVGPFPLDRGWPGEFEGSFPRVGGFLYGAAEFDAEFFGISPNEALAMDPQQRLLLEVSWEALEDAGIDPVGLRGSSTGVFAGASGTEYLEGSRRVGDVRNFFLTGSAGSVLSGRVAYSFGFEGPAVTVDTACSSSLVSLHLAAQALRSGECSLALAGGVAVMASPSAFEEFDRQGGLASDGRCKSFAQAADGTGWAEGVGLVVLQRLSDARREGRRVLAVLRGSAVNQDGASNGLTAPNGPSQQRVIQRALASGGLSAGQVDVVEAHGTGTRLGDPIEAQAIVAAYGRDRPVDRPLWLGSVKSNIGHAQAAAGVAGVIKMVMAIRHGVVPATLHVDEPSAHVDWDAGAVRLVTEPVEWPETGGLRRAGVSAFGISGTNAHVIVEQADPRDEQAGLVVREQADPGDEQAGLVVREQADPGDEQAGLVVREQADPGDEQAGLVVREQAAVGGAGLVSWVVSGKSRQALVGQARRLLDWARRCPDLPVGDVAGALVSSRAVFEHRAVVTGADREQLLAGLAGLAAGEPGPGVVSGVARAGGGRVAFVFPGQGSQWVGMGRQLMSWPVFAETMDECEQALAPLLPQGLLKVMFAEPSDPLAALLEDTVFAQAGLFAVGVALGRLVRSWGVRPDFVAGHSVGEITAACVAGVLPLPSACALVAARGQLMRQLPPGGAMAAVNADLATMAKFLAQYPQVSLAAVNGPSAVVVSGPEPAVTQVCAALTDAGHKCTRLRVSHGFHSALMDPILGELRQVLRGVPWREAHVPLVSTVTGKIIGPEQWNDPAHWLANARDTVRFADTVRTLHDNGVDTYIELGPDATLTAMIPDNLPEGDGGQALAVPVLRRDRDDRVSALTAAARLFTAGIAVDWSAVPASAASATVSSRAARIELPTYAFQRRRFWPTPVAARSDVSEVGQVVVDHPLLGAGLELPESGGVVFTGRVSLRSSPWLADHVVSGSVLFPGAGFVDLVSYAGEQLGYGRVEELLLHVPLVVPDGGASHIQVVLAASDNDGARPVSVYARPDTGTGIDYGEGDGGWVCYATGQLLATGTETDATREHSLPPVWPPAGAIAVDVEDLYIRLADQGFDYGPVFRGVQVLWRRGEDVFAEIALADGVSADAAAFGIHPALLDIAMHALAAGERLSPTEQASTDAGNAAAGGVLAPFSFSGVTVHTVGASMGRVHVRPVGPGSVSVSVFDLAGDPVITVDRLTLREVDLRGHETADVDRSLFQVHWTPTLPTATATATAPTTATVAATAAVGAADWLFLGSPAPAMPGAGIVKDREELVADIRAGVAAPPVLAVVLQEPAGLETLTAVRALAAEVLEHLQWWLRNEDVFDDSRLLFLSRNAVQADAGAGDGMPSVAMAAIWGLVRAAQAENPGRFVLADLDESAASWQALPAAVLGGEPQLMLRGGRVLTPRMQKLLPGDELSAPRPWDRNGTVLITGGLSGLGAVMARHAVVEHGIRHLLLLGRRAARTPGAQDLMAELAGLGARVGVIGCDVADRDQLAAALEEISPAHPLTAVIHAAGVLDDGVVEAMTPQRLDTTLAPKLDAAWHLHELTSQEDLAAFVVFSSVSGILGSAGQGNYAAANAGLDALIGMRRTMGQPGLSLAWGLWQQTGMAAHLGRADVKRLAGAGFREITATEGVAMFDRALGSMVPLVVAMPLNLRIVQQQRQVPHLLRGLIRDVRHDAAAGDGSGGLRQRLERVDADVRLAVVSELVRSEVAAVLGHTGADAVDAHRAFNEIGFDSLSAVELRNRLTTATGLKLPATLIFDYPSSHVLADYLVTRIDGSPRSKPPILPSPAGAMTEPIAIVGMACRFPGGVTAPDDLWKMVVDGTDAIGDFPLDRGWDVGELVDPSGVRTNSTYVGRGGFLYEAAAFDPAFFGISPNEALVMDPQQRLLLEVSWEAVERAGIDPLSLKGSSTGVFAGMMYHDYRSNSNTGSIASGRVSYVLGLEGPAVTVDTACSSSLVSLHLAGQALRSGECSLALAGGVAVMATPETFVEFSRQKGLARDGRCKSFAASADGTGWAEGVGVLVVERLSDARRNGHRVLAVVAGSAVNQDGASNGLMAPNGPSQVRVIRQALAAAGLSPGEVDVVEAHGTGTVLGDPIEAQALLTAYGQDRSGDRPLWLGSLKSNIGHAQAAAGVGGVIKMVMAMREGVLPRTLHVDEPSRQVDWASGAVRLLTEQRAWPEVGRVRRAGVSSFGISGTNAHVILEQGDPVAGVVARPVERPVSWVVSARSVEGLRGQAARLADFVERCPEVDLADVGFSLAVSRARWEHRGAVAGVDRESLVEGLRVLARGGGVCGVARARGGTGFLFTGQGAQRVGMGRELMVFPVFAAALEECLAVLPAGLREVMWGSDPEVLARTEFAQPALFAFEVALFRLLESWGVRPDVVIGHSVGEIAAAYVSGVFSLADAGRLVSERGRLMQVLPVGGAMLSVRLSPEAVAGFVSDRVGVAAVNGPESVVLSGERLALEELGVPGRWLKVSHAFHSPLMGPMLEEFAGVVRQLSFGQPRLVAISTVEGVADWSSPEYWIAQVTETVRFQDAVEAARASGVSRFVEIGPDATLTALLEDPMCVPAQRRDREEAVELVTALGRLHCTGVPVDWNRFYKGARAVELPTHAFQHTNYWRFMQPDSKTDPGSLGQSSLGHPLLGAVLPLAGSDCVVFTGRMSVGTHGWLADHMVGDQVVVPGAVFVELAGRAADEVNAGGIRELTLEAPLALDAMSGAAVQVVVRPKDVGSFEVEVFSRPADGADSWVRNATGVLGEPSAPDVPSGAEEPTGMWPPVGAVSLDVGGLYERLASAGLVYGPVFQGLQAAWSLGDQIFAEVELGDVPTEGFAVHPALLDACLHAIALMPGWDDRTRVPFTWSDVALRVTGATTVRLRVTQRGEDAVSLSLTDTAGAPVADIGRLALRVVSPGEFAAADSKHLFQVTWAPIAVGPEVPADIRVLRAHAGSGPDDVRVATRQALEWLRQGLADPGHPALAVVTSGAMGLDGEDAADLAGAAVWGLVRSAQSEHPQATIILVDAADDEGLNLALRTGEPQVVVRRGLAYGARLIRSAAATTATEPATRFTSTGTVLLTGASGALGGLLARHLVTQHGVRRLLLTSRRGAAASGAGKLAEELRGLGAEARWAACDVADRAALADLLASVDDLTGVVHVAGVLDDGVLTSLTPERIDAVLRPKVDAALNLHELTANRQLTAFVLFSSAAGVFGSAGQANYAAANTCLDALARHRHRAGLAGQSLAWGLWEGGGMGTGLAERDRARLAEAGVRPLNANQGLQLFDEASATDAPAVVPVLLDPSAAAGPGTPPPLLRSLVRRPARRAMAAAGMRTGTDLRARLAGLPADRREALILDFVCEQVAAKLGHAGGDQIEAEMSFSALGFDSLSAVELRNTINAETSLNMPATLIFDYPNAQALARHLAEALAPVGGPGTAQGTDEHGTHPTQRDVSVGASREAGRVSAAGSADPAETDDLDEMDADGLISLALSSVDTHDNQEAGEL